MLRYVLVFIAGALLGANALYYLMTRDDARPTGVLVATRSPAPDAVPGQTGQSPDAPARVGRMPAPPAAPSQSTPTTPAAVSPPAPTRPAPIPGPAGLIVPVQGITPAQLSNTFDDARGTERVHEALDIMAPRGTPVLAVADGRIEKLFDSKQGGLTLYQFEPSGRFAYYYAHLDRYAAGIAEGQSLRQGQVLGYVGSTGNADPDGPHLHFAIYVLGPEKQWHNGTPINPYPLLGGR